MFVNHAQRLGHVLAVQRVGGARQRGGSQRQAVGATPHVLHALHITGEHLDIGQQVVRKAHRLRHLQMGEARQDDLHVPLCHAQQGALQLGQQGDDLVDFVPQPQAHIGGHLVVAAAAGVQAFARITHQLGEAGLDVEVHVFEFQLPLEATGFDVGLDLRHAPLDGGQVVGTEDALLGQHARVGQ